MKTLVIAEHNNSELSAATLSVVEAAKKLGKEIDILVASNSANTVVDQAKSVEGVSKILSFNLTIWLSSSVSDNCQPAEIIRSEYCLLYRKDITSQKRPKVINDRIACNKPTTISPLKIGTKNPKKK